MGIYTEKAKDQGFDLGDLLPTKASDGAPPDNRYLFHIEEASVKESTSDNNNGVPYISARAVVDEPTEFQGYSLFPGFWLFPTEEPGQTSERMNKKTRDILSIVLGEDAYKQATERPTTHAEQVEAFADALDAAKPSFVARVGVDSKKKVEKTGYPAKNTFQFYYPADAWGEAGGTDKNDELPF